MNKKLLLIIGVVISVFVLAIVVFLLMPKTLSLLTATNFEECTKVEGSITRESYPRVCVLTSGEQFTEEVPEDQIVPISPVVEEIPEPAPEDNIFTYDDCASFEGSAVNGPRCFTPMGKMFVQEGYVEPEPEPTPEPILYDTVRELLDSRDTPAGNKNVAGTLVTGATGGRDYCADGYYIQDSTGMLLVKIMGPEGTPVLYSDPEKLGKIVEVEGQYPTQDAFCAALMCDCEDYILARYVLAQ